MRTSLLHEPPWYVGQHCLDSGMRKAVISNGMVLGQDKTANVISLVRLVIFDITAALVPQMPDGVKARSWQETSLVYCVEAE